MRTCADCEYSEECPWGLVCMGQKNAPRVMYTHSCEDWKPRHFTKADRIRAMTDEKLAMLLSSLAGCPLNVMETCPGKHKPTPKCSPRPCWLDWLQQEAKEDTTHEETV